MINDLMPKVGSGKVRVLDDRLYEDEDFTGHNDFPSVLPNPTREERRDIKLYRTIYKGVMFVTGGARQGKDLFGVSVSYKMGRYFGRRILLDFKPMRLFGEYTPFNPQLMMLEINKMARLSAVTEGELNRDMTEKESKAFSEAALEWIDDNILVFQNSVVYFSELGRYCPRRNPHNRVNRFIGALASQWGHLDMLIIGTHLQFDEIDSTTFMEKSRLRVQCKWMRSRPNTTQATIIRDMALEGNGVAYDRQDPMHYKVDGGAPREYLTRPDTVFAITPQGRRETGNNVLLAMLARGNMTGEELGRIGAGVEETLQALFTLSQMGYVVGNRFFDLYKSKNVVNLKPTLAKEA